MKLLLYCTKANPYLVKRNIFAGIEPTYFTLEENVEDKLNGKIVAECDFEVEDLRIVDDDPLGAYWYETKTLSENEVLEKSCLTSDELYEYLGDYNEGYAIHIKNLHIFDKPRELSEHWIKQAPQNMCYGWCQSFAIDERVIIISIRPEWLCKILNGEKTIEVRKKVLKEMIK